MSNLNNHKWHRRTLKNAGIVSVIALCASVLNVDLALASSADDIFGATSPFTAFTNFITGPFAYFIAIVAIVVFGAMLISGSDFGGLSRKAPMVLLAIGIVLGAKTIIDKLYGGSTGAIYAPVEENHGPAKLGGDDGAT